MDPLNRHKDNFNIKPHEGNDTAIRRNFVHQKLVDLINYIKNALRSIAYIISPTSNPVVYNSHIRGEDIATVEPTDCGNEVVNQEMLKFSDNVNKFWENNTPEEIVDFFMKSAQANTSDVSDATVNTTILIAEGKIPGITEDELAVFSKIHGMVTDIDIMDKIKQHGNSKFKVTFRDIKTFYNVFMKYMNYAIKNEPKHAARAANLEKLFFGDFQAVQSFKQDAVTTNYSKVLDSDRKTLKSDDDFVMLLQSLKEYVSGLDEHPRKHEGVFYNLIGNILEDNKNWPMHYADLKRLKRSADTVGNILAKKNNGELTESEYYFDMLIEAGKTGIAPIHLVQDLLRTSAGKREISDNEFEAIILKHGFGEKMNGLMAAMESLPDIANKALSQIDLDTQLKHVIETNILNY